MHHSSKFVSFNHTKHHFTRKLTVFDTYRGSNPVRVWKVQQVDTMFQLDTMRHLSKQHRILQSLYHSVIQSVILPANFPFLVQFQVRIPCERQRYCKLMQHTTLRWNANANPGTIRQRNPVSGIIFTEVMTSGDVCWSIVCCFSSSA